MSKLLSMLHTVNSESPDLSGLFTLWDFCLPSFIVPPNGHAVFYAPAEETPLGGRRGSLRGGQWRAAVRPGQWAGAARSGYVRCRTDRITVFSNTHFDV